MSKRKLTLRFNWTTCTADPRQYNQQRQILEPVTSPKSHLGVAVEIPLTEEFVYNAKAVISGLDLNADPVPEPMLTPAGMFLAIQILEV